MISINDIQHDDMRVKINQAILEKCIIEFKYTNKTKNREETRIVEPYLLGINEQGNLFVSGYFRATEEQIKNEMKSEHKNFLVDGIEEDSLIVSSKKFDSLKVEHPDKIYKTTKTIVLAVAYFPEIIIKTYFS
ncbi:WYL domain-containing protein [Segetibacter aerophilus]|uniref:WYL domain-containing protein n=1 Tax=Segetibacter aerophilus TaxID=670293 RepID=A0A512B6F8_9BACT|nr:WYL domain-containing protein [Segetibacter aerophilus]GEO07554.1 hypothetical protein SAE01_00500 [Segetibacter aerophilus]